MKKIFLTAFIMFFLPSFAAALDDSSVMNLKAGQSYVIELNARPMNLQNSNPKIVTAEAVTDIYSTDSSIMLTTREEGIAYINFKLKNKLKTIKLLIDNNAPEDTGLLIIDKADDNKNQ